MFTTGSRWQLIQVCPLTSSVFYLQQMLLLPLVPPRNLMVKTSTTNCFAVLSFSDVHILFAYFSLHRKLEKMISTHRDWNCICVLKFVYIFPSAYLKLVLLFWLLLWWLNFLIPMLVLKKWFLKVFLWNEHWLFTTLTCCRWHMHNWFINRSSSEL